MKKRILSLSLSLIMAFCLVTLGGCGDNNSPSASTPGSPGQPESAAPGEVYELSVTITQPAESVVGKIVGEWCETIQERSENRLKLVVSYSGTLLPVTDTITGVMDGFADIGFIPSNIGKDYFPITCNLMAWPFINYPGAEKAQENLKTIRKEFPEVDKEFEDNGLKLLAFYPMGRNDLWFPKEMNVKAPEDLKGLKIGVASSFFNDYLVSLGAAPVFITNADMYTDMDNGVVDGIIQHLALLRSTGTIDTVKGATIVGSSGMLRDLSLYIMNAQKFNSLPADLQEILMQGIQDMQDDACIKEEVARDEFYAQMVADGSVNIVELTDDEAAAWSELFAGLHETELDKLEEKCPTIRTIYERLIELNAAQ